MTDPKRSHHSPKTPAPPKYSDAELAKMHRLYVTEGKPASEVGEIMGVSRNTVIGHAHRKGWVRRPEVGYRNSLYRNEREAQRREPKPPVARAPKFNPNPILPKPEPVMASEPKPFIERRPLECAWIVSPDGAEPMVCAARICRGSYCARHFATSHQPPRERRTERLAGLNG